MACQFLKELNKLRKSSIESVESADSKFCDYKQYLHVERPVEKELKALIERVTSPKCLILLCGSAGDGKSHLLSYLKTNNELLLKNYRLYNDATASSAPNLTSIDTLAEELSPFSDDNVDNLDPYKMILAINLGTLNNFIESDIAKDKYKKLKNFVDQNNILYSYGDSTKIEKDSVFQYVSFADYQVFSLKNGEVKTNFLEELISKIFKKDESNPFYNSFLDNCSNCHHGTECPINHNYSFLSEEKVQSYIIERIVQTTIINKTLVSTRDVLNLIYDLLVHPDFDIKTFDQNKKESFLKNYISWTTPMLLNEYDDISPLIDMIKKSDSLNIRTQDSDSEAIKFHASESISAKYETLTRDTPYYKIKDLSIVNKLLDSGLTNTNQLKSLIYRFLKRLNDINVSNQSKRKERLTDFIKYLYYANRNENQELQNLYDLVKKAIYRWYGDFGGQLICIDDSLSNYWILEDLRIIPSATVKPKNSTNDEIYQFSPTIELRIKEKTKPEEVIFKIDFSLYELICNMDEGYKPSIFDKNIYAEFVGGINQLIELGDKSESMIFMSKSSTNKIKCTLKIGDFGGYSFEVNQQ